AGNQRDLPRLERFAVLGHVRIVAAYHLDEVALLRIAGSNGTFVLASFEHHRDGGQVEIALELLGFMTGITVGNKDGANLPVIAHRMFISAHRGTEKKKRND